MCKKSEFYGCIMRITCYNIISERKMRDMDNRLNVLISSETKQKLEEKAKSMGLNLSAYVRLILTQTVNENN